MGILDDISSAFDKLAKPVGQSLTKFADPKTWHLRGNPGSHGSHESVSTAMGGDPAAANLAGGIDQFRQPSPMHAVIAGLDRPADTGIAEEAARRKRIFGGGR